MLKRFASTIILITFAVINSFAQSFTLPIKVSDGANYKVINIGVAHGATNGNDSGLDTLAPPAPPPGAFDARLSEGSLDYFTDIRSDSLKEKVYHISYAAATGEGPIVLSWDKSKLNSSWTYVITDDITGSSYTLNM